MSLEIWLVVIFSVIGILDTRDLISHIISGKPDVKEPKTIIRYLVEKPH